MNTTFDEKIKLRLHSCPVLGSLRSVSDELSALSEQPNSPLGQIADVIARDPSLTTRLLRVVNSVYIGLSVRINSIEEAVLILGLRQVRQLAIATRIIDESEDLQEGFPRLDWAKVWRHSIGVGILSREILSSTAGFQDDGIDYLSGLVHNIGKVVMAHSFPDEFCRSLEFNAESAEEFVRMEREAFGWTHADLGGFYLDRHNLSEEVIEVARFHHEPEHAPAHTVLASAVQVADAFARYAGIDSGIENVAPVKKGDWENLTGWQLFFSSDGRRSALARASILNSVERLPSLLHGLI